MSHNGQKHSSWFTGSTLHSYACLRLRIRWETVQVRVLSSAPNGNRRSLLPGKEVRRPFFFLRLGENMDPNFKPYRTGMLMVREKYPCGRGDGHKGRNHVYYLCRCDCGKEVIFSGDEIAKHSYSCGCTRSLKSGKHPARAIAVSLGTYQKFSCNFHSTVRLILFMRWRPLHKAQASFPSLNLQDA